MAKNTCSTPAPQRVARPMIPTELSIEAELALHALTSAWIPRAVDGHIHEDALGVCSTRDSAVLLAGKLPFRPATGSSIVTSFMVIKMTLKKNP